MNDLAPMSPEEEIEYIAWIDAFSDDDLINMAMFDCTAADWAERYPVLSAAGETVRSGLDDADQVLLDHLIAKNTEWIALGADKRTRLDALNTLVYDADAIIAKNFNPAPITKPFGYVLSSPVKAKSLDRKFVPQPKKKKRKR